MTLERAVLFEHLRRILVQLHENAHKNNNNIGDDKGKELKLIKELLGVTSPFVLLLDEPTGLHLETNYALSKVYSLMIG